MLDTAMEMPMTSAAALRLGALGESNPIPSGVWRGVCAAEQALGESLTLRSGEGKPVNDCSEEEFVKELIM